MKVVGTKFILYKVWDGDEILLAQDTHFNFPGDANFRDDGDFQDVVGDDDRLRELFHAIRRTRMRPHGA